MQYVTYAILTWAILTICGLPLAICLLPRHLRRLAIPLAPTFAYSYIVFVCFHIFRTNIGGTDLFATYVVVPPVCVLLALAWYGRREIGTLFSQHAMLMVGMAWLSFAVLSTFYLLAGGRAVSLTILNADLQELAAIARYMQEFPRDTTVGFMAPPNNFVVQSDYVWFGASMLSAVMSSLLRSEPYRLQSLVLVVVASQACSFVYAIARENLSFNRATSVAVGVVYAFSPVVAYMVWQSFGGQIISTTLMLGIVYLVSDAQTRPAEARVQFSYFPAVLLLLCGMFVTYHFMVPIVAVLLCFYIAVVAALERSWPRLLYGAAPILAAALLAVALNPVRVQGALMMFNKLSTGGNGWFIPWLSPDVQLGFAASKLFGYGGFSLLDYDLNPRRIPGIVVAVALAAAAAWCLLRERGQQLRLAFVLGLAVPVLLLGFYYAVKETNADGVLGSYRSYKFTSMFLAFTLISLATWFGAQDLRGKRWRALLGASLAAILVAVSALELATVRRYAAAHAFIPKDELMQIKQIESMDFVSGVDVMDDNGYALYWAHYFLLRKPQAFQSFFYGGRVGPLIHPYRLQQSYPLLSLDEQASASRPAKLQRAARSGNPTAMGDIFVTPGGTDCVERYPITSRLELCKVPPDARIAMSPGGGWWYREPWGRWSGQKGRDAEIFIDTPVERSVRLRAVYEPLAPGRTIALSVDGVVVPAEVTSTELVSAPISLKPGRNVALLTANFDPETRKDDGRTLGVKWKRVFVESPQASTAATGGGP